MQRVGVLAVVVAGLTASADAATIYWAGASGQTWSVTTNWSTTNSAPNVNPASPPGASDDVIFSRSGIGSLRNVTVDGSRAALSITHTGSSNVSILTSSTAANSGTLAIGSGGITKSSTVAFGIGATNNEALVIRLAAPQTWQMTSDARSSMTIGGRTELDGNGLTLQSFTTTATVNMQTSIVGTGSVTIGGAGSNGTVLFGGVSSRANTYTGPTTVNSGTLSLNHQGTNVAIPGTLVIGDGVNPAVVDLTLRNEQIADTSSVTVNSGGLFWVTKRETIGALEGVGTVMLAGISSGTIVSSDFLVGAAGTNFAFGGTITGTIADPSSPGVTAKVGNLYKVGSGTMSLSGTSTYGGVTAVTAGRLAVDGDISASSKVAVGVGTVLQGAGRVSAIVGGGTAGGLVSPGNSPGILTATRTDPTGEGTLSYAFEMTGVGSPAWGTGTASTNDVLRLTDATTPFVNSLGAGNTISVYFNLGTLSGGEVFRGGFFTDRNSDFTTSVDGATYVYYAYDPSGTTPFQGVNYSLLATKYPSLTSVTRSVVQVGSATFSGGTVTDGWVQQFAIVPEPGSIVLVASGVGLLALRRLRRGRG